MTQIEAVMSRIATLSDAEIATLNATALPMAEVVAADNAVGAEATLVMAQVPEDTDPGVWAIARVAVLGILAHDDTLIRVWTDVVGPLEAQIDDALVAEVPEEVTEPVIGTPHTPTEPELADLGAPVETPAEEVASALVDAPLDIQEGEINV